MAIDGEADPGGPRVLEDYSISTGHVADGRQQIDPPPLGDVKPPEKAEGEGKKGEEPKVEQPVDSQLVADARGTRMAEQGHPAFPKPEKKSNHWVRRILILLVIAAVIGVALYFAIPAIQWAMSTASTDDAFVSGHTTYVSPRIQGVLTEVRVEQNDRVEPGTLLARLDREPFEIALAQSEASLEEAKANLDQSKAQVRSQLATARGAFFRRRTQQEQLRRQVKSLESQVATLNANMSSQKLAAVDQERIENLVKRGSASQSELDQRNNTLDVANSRVREAWTRDPGDSRRSGPRSRLRQPIEGAARSHRESVGDPDVSLRYRDVAGPDRHSVRCPRHQAGRGVRADHSPRLDRRA